jgi:hypothetical protein
MTEEKSYYPEHDENAMEFIHRVIIAQPDCEPLRIVEQLVEIAVGELKDRPYDISAKASTQRMVVTLRHHGKPIDERMVWVMGDHTDHVDYHPNETDDGWVLTIYRDIPPLFVTRRY